MLQQYCAPSSSARHQRTSWQATPRAQASSCALPLPLWRCQQPRKAYFSYRNVQALLLVSFSMFFACPGRLLASLGRPGRPRPPRNIPHHIFGPHREHFQTSQVVSSVVGCAMHMKWPDGIGRGSWDWENPRQESANEKSGIARTDLPYHWVSPCGWKRVGPPVIIVVVEYYIYLYIYCCCSG